MAHDIKSTIRQILLETVMFDTYSRTSDDEFVPIGWEESPLLDEAVERIVQTVRKENVVNQALASLTKDGKPLGMMQCNGCGYVEAYQPTDVTPEEFQAESKAAIMKTKEHFANKGWQTSWGYDLCPECAKEGKFKQ